MVIKVVEDLGQIIQQQNEREVFFLACYALYKYDDGVTLTKITDIHDSWRKKDSPAAIAGKTPLENDAVSKRSIVASRTYVRMEYRR